MHRIHNDQLSAAITLRGVELASLVDRATELEYIWQADPEVWGSHAPVLFPIIGGLRNGTFQHQGKTYTLPKHGIVRGNDDLVVVAQTADSITLELTANAKTRQVYPFEFVFRITYRLEDRTLVQEHEVRNAGKEPMYFSVGGHPAFRVPLHKGEAYNDYFLDFATPETAPRYIVNPEGLIAAETVAVPWQGSRLPLTHELFANDALVFKTLESRRVALVSQQNGLALTVDFPDFNYLGIWAKPTGDFVCIEPWLGIADAHNASGELAEKEGIIGLKAGEVFLAAFRLIVA